MNKTDLIAAVAEKAGLAKTDAKKALEAFVSTVSEELAKGESARTGINPATKQTITIPAKKVVKFKAGAELAEKVK